MHKRILYHTYLVINLGKYTFFGYANIYNKNINI